MIKPAQTPDWQDTRKGSASPSLLTAREAYETSFQNLPRWVMWAMTARNKLVSLFGLKTENESGQELMLSLPVIEETPERYEVGIADKHLTFTIITTLANQQASMTTSIWFNHWLGRAYLAVVYIPHKIIVRLAVKAMA